MGNWGISAHQSDCGLDLLAVAKERILRGVKFRTFHVRHITEFLRSHIIDEFVAESNGWESQYIDFFYDYTFQYDFGHAVMLVAECFAEYHQEGRYTINDFSTEKGKKRWITEFVFTNKDLEFLRLELQFILNPQHKLYDSWKNSDSFNAWQAHMQKLCDTLSQAIHEGGDGNA